MGIQGGKTGVDPCKRRPGLFQILIRKVDRRTIVGREDEKAKGFGIEPVKNLSDGEKIPQRFTHLFGININEAVVQPVANELAAVAGFGLCDLVLVVRKYQVLSATMDIEGLA